MIPNTLGEETRWVPIQERTHTQRQRQRQRQSVSVRVCVDTYLGREVRDALTGFRRGNGLSFQHGFKCSLLLEHLHKCTNKKPKNPRWSFFVLLLLLLLLRLSSFSKRNPALKPCRNCNAIHQSSDPVFCIKRRKTQQEKQKRKKTRIRHRIFY